MTIPTPQNGRSVWLQVGTLIDGVNPAPLANAHIVFDEHAIRHVGGANNPPARGLLAGQTEPDADLPNTTLLPGLIEAHAHLFLEGGELDAEKRSLHLKKTSAELLEDARPRLKKLVRLGVIGVRDAGDRNNVGLSLSKLYSCVDRPLMPYMDSPGAAIHHKGRYGSFMSDPIEDHASPRACVASRVEAGADRIKLIPTGIINFKKGAVTSEPQMATDEVVALVEAAQSFGRQTFAHASGDIGIDHAIEGGVDSIEHGFFVRDDHLARMRDRNIAWVPTFAPVQKQVDHAETMGWSAEIISNLRRILDGHAASLVRAHEMGVTIIAGSDAGSYGVAHGVDFLYELELMERAGLAPLDVINSATGNSSQRLAYKEPFGRIQSGFLSRFILTEHSPLDGLSNLRKRRLVVFDGFAIESGPDDDVSGL